MITAVDSNILFDVFLADPTFGLSSRTMLQSASLEGRMIACDIVFAEISAYFPAENSAKAALEDLGIEFSNLDEKAALVAGSCWKMYKKQGGKNVRIISDFLIGAHAMVHADRLLTRDRGFYRKYFSKLALLA